MRVVALNPRWWAPEGRSGCALVIDCPHCVREARRTPMRLAIPVDPPLDGLPPVPTVGPGGPQDCYGALVAWHRTGADFASISLSPSINFATAAHWHGHIEHGIVTFD